MDFLVRSVRRLSTKQFVLLLFVALVVGAIGIAFVVQSQAPKGVLTVAVMDVGQGDSIYIESPTGVQVVVDAGPDNSILRMLPRVMPLFDRSLNAVVETHPDADHIAGFIELLKRYEVDEFIEPGIQKDTATAKNLEKEIVRENIPRVIARRGMVIDLGGGASLHVLYPDWDVSNMDQKKDNDGGVVLRLVYGKTSMLLMADTSNDVEHHLMAISSSSELKSDILKVGHHGSKTSSAEDFVAEVNPSVGIISVGAHNTYGHPTQTALSNLAAVGVSVLRTDERGTVVCTSNAVQFTCK